MTIKINVDSRTILERLRVHHVSAVQEPLSTHIISKLRGEIRKKKVRKKRNKVTKGK